MLPYRHPLRSACAFILFFTFCFPIHAVAIMTGSPHDFSSSTGQSYNRIDAIAPSGVCSGCHIPHKAQDYRLWPRSLSEERGKLKADGTTFPNYTGNPTLNCYDCHEHASLSNDLDNDPAKNDFSTGHRPPNTAFGYSGGSPGSGNWTSDPPGGSQAGYYENDPPNNAPNPDTINYGVYSGAIPPANTGGHYFKTADPDTGNTFERYDKLPCRDCHDPHTWENQAFIKKRLANGRPNLSGARASTNMSNALPSGSSPRDDDLSRDICTTCHGTSDISSGVSFNDINIAYSNTNPIIQPPISITQHNSGDTTACTDCHDHNSIGANCSNCHGFPPPPYFAPNIPSAYVPASDSHPRHYGRDSSGATFPATGLSYSFNCPTCHATSALGSGADHQNTQVNINFDLSVIGKTGPAPFLATVPPGGSPCNNLYCHSDARSAKTGTPTAITYNPIPWGSGDPGCEGCHGKVVADAATTYQYGAPDYVNSGILDQSANSHPAHVNSGIPCASCHYLTISADTNPADGWTLNAGVAFHVNGTIDVSIDPTIDTNGGTGADNYAPATKTCSAVSCHGTSTPVWGGSLLGGCFDCHSGTESGEKPQNDYGTAGTANPVTQAEYTHSGHGRASASGNYTGSGNPPAGFSDFTSGNGSDCYFCHDTNAQHTTKDVNDPFRLGTFAQNLDGLCNDCHGTGTLTNPNAATVTTGVQVHAESVFSPDNNYTWPIIPKCVDCHDPHGDGTATAERYYMIRSAINNPTSGSDGTGGSDPFGRPDITTLDLTSVTFNDLSGKADGSYASATSPGTGLCELCHNQPSVYNRAGASNAGSHSSRTNRCTTCHLHPEGLKGAGGPDIEQYFDSYSSGSNYDDQSRHPLNMTTDGTLTYSAEDNCISCHGAVDKQGGTQRYTNECLKCHFENQVNAPVTNHMDGTLQMAAVSGNSLPTAQFAINNITDYNSFCLQCHSGSPTTSLGGITPAGIFLKDLFPGSSNHMDSAVVGAGNEVGCIYCHNPHGRTNMKLLRENPADRRAQADTPSIFGVFPSENIPGSQNLPYRNRAWQADNTLDNRADSDDANGYCNAACHTYQKEMYIVRNNNDGYYVYSGNKKQVVGGTMSESQPNRHGHFNNEIISTDAMVDDYRAQPGAPKGAPYFQYPPGTGSADPSTYNPSTAQIKFYPDFIDNSRDFDGNSDYGSSPIRYRYVCQTCHEVHGTDFSYDVRMDYLSVSDLCLQCHR